MNEHTFLAGAAKGNITPSRSLMPMPFIWFIKFNKVVDPIYVRVLAMSDGVKQSLFIVFEMTLIPYAEETLQFISEQTGIPKENVFMAATHTHEATPIGLGLYKENSIAEKKCERWYRQIKTTLLAAVREAQKKMVPAKYGYGTGKSYINVNRDTIYEEGQDSRLGNNFERPSDKTIRMVRIEDMEGKVIALIINYACHAVVMNGCLVRFGVGITGDLPGRTSAKIEAQMEEAVVLWCSGAAGDQNPRIMTQYENIMVKGKPKVKNLGKTGYIILEWLADEHVRDILKTNKSIECDQTNGRFYGAEKIALVEPKEAGADKVPYVLRLFRLGDIVFQGISAEIVTTVGQAVQETSPYEKSILVSHAMGYQGYVADDWEYEHNAFEVGNSKAAKGAAQKTFVEVFQRMFAEERKQ